MKSGPLKDKKVKVFDIVGIHPMGVEYSKDGNLFRKDDVKSAVEWLKERLDDKLSDLTLEQIHYVRLLIAEAFKDVIK